jgi:hypothetical protein
MLAKAGVYHYNGNNIGLGTACGKYFRVSSLAITDPGTLVSPSPVSFFASPLVFFRRTRSLAFPITHPACSGRGGVLSSCGLSKVPHT